MDTMDGFQKRKKDFEKKFAYDQEVRFRVTTRQLRLLGEWTSEILGLQGEEAQKYVSTLIQKAIDLPGKQNVLAQIQSDFSTYTIPISIHRLDKEYERLLIVAKEQIKNE